MEDYKKDKNVLAKYVDHTILKADATKEDVKRVCDEAKENGFASVCVNACRVNYVAECLKGSGVTPCCVIGFPLGAMTTEAKAFEAEDAARKGAKELDMVVNVGAVKDGDWDYVEKDIKAVVDAAGDALVKVIIETSMLTDDEKVKVCQTAKKAGANFVKTCTGFSSGKATVEDITLMREAVGESVGVKASSGIKTFEDAVALIDAGANRLGTSAGIAIMTGQKSTSAY